jgi:GntR family transcriptional regulator/MocR family aminotransferase
MGELLAGLIDIDLQSGSSATLTRQLYDRLRATILTGALPPGRRLPSSRELARQLGVSRNTVSFVVDQLVMEGYLDVAQGRRPTVAAAANAGLVAGRPISRGGPRALRTSRWRRSADRTRLHANSLLIGNITGKIALLRLLGPISRREAPVLQPLLEQFPS